MGKTLVVLSRAQALAPQARDGVPVQAQVLGAQQPPHFTPAPPDPPSEAWMLARHPKYLAGGKQRPGAEIKLHYDLSSQGNFIYDQIDPISPHFEELSRVLSFLFFFDHSVFVVVVVCLFPFIFISWRLITLQYCSGFCHTLT